MKSLSHRVFAMVLVSVFVSREGAAIIIDDFSVVSGLVQSAGPSSQTQTVSIDAQNASRTLLANGNAVTAKAAIQSTGSVLNIALEPAPSETLIVQSNYTGFTADISSDPFFQISLNGATQSFLIGMTFRSSTATSSLASVLPVSATSLATVYEVDLRQLNNFTPAFLNGLNEIEFAVESIQSGPMSVEIGLLEFSPTSTVPEPQSWPMVAALAALATAVGARRRRVRPSANLPWAP